MDKKKNNDTALIMARINTLLKNGRKKIKTKEELKTCKRGSLVSYLTNSGVYKEGGYLEKIKDNYFIITKIDDTKYKIYFDKISYMFVGSPIRKLNRTNIRTNYPVKIGNKTIYYAKDNFDKERFMCTDRYNLMKKWYDKYRKPTESQIEV